ncbi:cytidine deaminase, partial [bacterium]|nr:cytidine deaminase [bacterium]
MEVARMRSVTYNELTELQIETLDEAERIMERAYNPYSNFFVGACLVSDTGILIPGANFENASYELAMCAERSAV